MKKSNQVRNQNFENCVSKAGQVSADAILIASKIHLFVIDIHTGKTNTIIALEEEKPETHSNDGLADQLGGFCIGTMGKGAPIDAGLIYC